VRAARWCPKNRWKVTLDRRECDPLRIRGANVNVVIAHTKQRMEVLRHRADMLHIGNRLAVPPCDRRRSPGAGLLSVNFLEVLL